uniref:Prefoldin subunit 4 n=1 Tax=Alexandrium monilatum TaxID=311494 RepID=A0A7S4PTB7_9DINO
MAQGHFCPSRRPGIRGRCRVRTCSRMAVEQKDIEVEKDDQQRINAFSRLNLRYDELDEEIKELKKSIQTYKDATEEIEGCMEDNGIALRIGEAFTPVEEDAAIEKLSKLTEQSEVRLTECTNEIEDVKTRMDVLKKVLYSKFGTSINLEK